MGLLEFTSSVTFAWSFLCENVCNYKLNCFHRSTTIRIIYFFLSFIVCIFQKIGTFHLSFHICGHELFTTLPYCTSVPIGFAVIASPLKSICQTHRKVTLPKHKSDCANTQLKALQRSPTIFEMKSKVLSKALHHLTTDFTLPAPFTLYYLNSSSSFHSSLLLECVSVCTHSLKISFLACVSSSSFYLITSY